MTDVPVLQPCPFCGSVDIKIKDVDGVCGIEYAAYCNNCGVFAPSFRWKSYAIHVWNRRYKQEVAPVVKPWAWAGDDLERCGYDGLIQTRLSIRPADGDMSESIIVSTRRGESMIWERIPLDIIRALDARHSGGNNS